MICKKIVMLMKHLINCEYYCPPAHFKFVQKNSCTQIPAHFQSVSQKENFSATIGGSKGRSDTEVVKRVLLVFFFTEHNGVFG